jgi:hypothetical protein
MPTLKYWDVAANDYIEIVGPPGATGPPGPSNTDTIAAQVERKGALTIGTGYTEVLFDTVVHDTNSLFDSALGYFRFLEEGWWEINAGISVVSVPDQWLAFRVSTSNADRQLGASSGSVASPLSVFISFKAYVVGGAGITTQAVAGAPMNLLTSYSTWEDIHYLGPTL